MALVNKRRSKMVMLAMFVFVMGPITSHLMFDKPLLDPATLGFSIFITAIISYAAFSPRKDDQK